MKFLCLVYEDPKAMQQMPKATLDKVIADYMTFTKEIEKSRHFNAGDGLEPGHTPRTVRVRNGKVSTSDGPQEMIKNTIGGFYVIRAGDESPEWRSAHQCAENTVHTGGRAGML